MTKCPNCGRESIKDYPWQQSPSHLNDEVRIGVHFQESDCLGEAKPTVAWSEIRRKPVSITGYEVLHLAGSGQ